MQSLHTCYTQLHTALNYMLPGTVNILVIQLSLTCNESFSKLDDRNIADFHSNCSGQALLSTIKLVQARGSSVTCVVVENSALHAPGSSYHYIGTVHAMESISCTKESIISSVLSHDHNVCFKDYCTHSVKETKICK